jgi:hypothetical protein
VNNFARPCLLALNILGYQAVWFAAVAGAGRGLAWAGPLAALVFAAATLALGGKRSADLRSLALALPVGIALDSAFAASGWLQYAQPWPWSWAAPAWIWALWVGFALTFNHSLGFLGRSPGLATLLGLVGGPLSYWVAASGFDAVAFGAPPVQVLVALGLAWALALPALLAVNRRLTAPAVALA